MTKTERVASLESSKPAVQAVESMIELQKAISQIDLERLSLIPGLGDLLAKDLIQVSTALSGLIQQASDVVEEAKKTLSTSHTLIKNTNKALITAKQALEMIQAPKIIEKTALEVLLSMVPAASLIISLLTLSVVLIRA